MVNIEASKSFLNSIKVQLKSSKIANEGIAAEYERGSRTTLMLFNQIHYCFCTIVFGKFRKRLSNGSI